MRTSAFVGSALIAILISLPFSFSAQADIVHMFDATQIDDYNRMAGQSDWSFADIAGRKDAWTFTVENSFGDQVHGSLDSIKLEDQKNGNSGFKGVDVRGDGSLTFSHNTSLLTNLSFSVEDIGSLTGGGFIDSFYFAVGEHDNNHDGITVTAKDRFGNEYSLSGGEMSFDKGLFFGFVFDDELGADNWFTEFELTVDGEKNNGGFKSVTVGFGYTEPPMNDSGGASTPEPATLLIFGLAAATGLPFVLRRRARRLNIEHEMVGHEA